MPRGLQSQKDTDGIVITRMALVLMASLISRPRPSGTPALALTRCRGRLLHRGKVGLTRMSGSIPFPTHSRPSGKVSCFVHTRALPPPGNVNESGWPALPPLGSPMIFPRPLFFQATRKSSAEQWCGVTIGIFRPVWPRYPIKDLDPIERMDWTSPEFLDVTLGMSRSSLSVQCFA